MKVQIIQVPYDSGHRGVRMGRGPEHFIHHGIDQMLRARGHEVHVDTIEASIPFRAEIATAFELNRSLAEHVRAALTRRSFPLVLSGNCNSCLGTLAGINSSHVGIVWFDGHGDFNTPETTVGGFLDGMGLATATGRCWKTMATGIPGFRPVPETNVALVGARDFDPQERELLEGSRITLVTAESIRRNGVRVSLEPALAALSIQSVYLHVDLDVLDPEEAVANEFAPSDGLTVDQLEEAIRMIGERFMISAGAIAAYDPGYDEEGKTLRAGGRIMDVLLAASNFGLP